MTSVGKPSRAGLVQAESLLLGLTALMLPFNEGYAGSNRKRGQKLREGWFTQEIPVLDQDASDLTLDGPKVVFFG